MMSRQTEVDKIQVVVSAIGSAALVKDLEAQGQQISQFLSYEIEVGLFGMVKLTLTT